jgi:hypothetical protein
MPFVRVLLLAVALLGIVIVGFAFFRPDPNAVPAPQVEAAPLAPRPIPTVAAPRQPAVMSPGDASSPAEITAREAEEAQRRLEQEAGESKMMVPEAAPVEMMPPDVAPPVKSP